MLKVITYGTFDHLHYGHIKLLERAKSLGDYLIVGVTTDDFDKSRGKINVQQSLMERVEAIRTTGIADEIIIEEFEGQKIDDIKRYNVDIFTVGSDWAGMFDYLNEYCKVIYLPRTDGISSTEIRSKKKVIRLGLIGDAAFLNKVYNETKYVNGINVSALLTSNPEIMIKELLDYSVTDFNVVLDKSDAIYIRSLPQIHYEHIKKAIKAGKHVLCESPLTLDAEKTNKLFDLALKNNVILMEGIKTAYSTAFLRLILLVKGGKIGNVVSVDSTCTSLNKTDWPGIFEWGPTALLPVFALLGFKYEKAIVTQKDVNGNDMFTKIDFLYDHAIASIKVGDGVKSEGQLIISGTNGYIFVPSPWWKTEYFEIRYENSNDNKRYFYPLEGEGIRYELVAFARAIETGRANGNIDKETSVAISKIMEDYQNDVNIRYI